MSVKSILYFLLLLNHSFTYPVTLIFDPAGDAKDPGRLIGQTYERTATLHLANKIKEHIATLDKKALVLFSRLPGEQKDSIEKMRFVQQCNPDLFIHITVYHSSHIKPQIHVYYNVLNEMQPNSKKILVPVSPAHAIYTPRSKELTTLIHTSLLSGSQRSCDSHMPVSIPCSPLIGIAAPACMIEIGIQTIEDLDHCIAPLAESILKACSGKMQ